MTPAAEPLEDARDAAPDYPLTVSAPGRRSYAASELPQLPQNRDAGASTTAPHWAQFPLRYFPHDEQNAGSDSGLGPHVSHARRTER